MLLQTKASHPNESYRFRPAMARRWWFRWPKCRPSPGWSLWRTLAPYRPWWRWFNSPTMGILWDLLHDSTNKIYQNISKYGNNEWCGKTMQNPTMNLQLANCMTIFHLFLIKLGMVYCWVYQSVCGLTLPKCCWSPQTSCNPFFFDFYPLLFLPSGKLT